MGGQRRMNRYGRSKTGRLMLIGGLVGGALSLLGRDTRFVWGRRLQTFATNSGKLIYTVFRHPDQVGRYLQTTGTQMRTTAQSVSENFQRLLDDVDQARTRSSDAYRYVMEAGNEIGSMAGKIRETGQQMIRFQQAGLVETAIDASDMIENGETNADLSARALPGGKTERSDEERD